MVLETPLLRVSRPVAACSRCRAAKVKCDGKLPACTACEKANKSDECSSTNDQFARGKERSYVATLEARVEKLEKKIEEAKARRQSSLTMLDYDPASTPRKLSTDTIKRPLESKRAARRRELFNIDSLVSDFGLLAVNATARDFYGFTTAMSYARLLLSACTKEPLPSGLIKQLPPRYAATPLIQHYVNNVFVLLPIFEEASLYASVDAVYSQDSRKAQPFDHWIVRLVLALASISFSEQRGDTHYSDAVGHINAALVHAEEVLHPGHISSVQALVLLVEYAMADPQHFDSWALIGAASRALVDLGLHQDPSKSLRVSKPKLEIRRRVYYCVYALDRSTSLVQARSFSFSDDSTNVTFPFQHKATSTTKHTSKNQVWTQTFDTALDFFKLRKIQSQYYTDMFQSGRNAWNDPYPYIWKTYNNLTEWHNAIGSSTLPSLKAFFELELLYSYVYLLLPSPRCPNISTYAQHLIFEHCISYAANLLAVIDSSTPLTKPVLTCYDAMRAYMTGRQFIDVLARNQETLLSPVPPQTPPIRSPPVDLDADVDPLAPAPTVAPPPLPTPAVPSTTSDPSVSVPKDKTSRAINAIQDFNSILSRFGLRFGLVTWGERFQRESAQLLAQLYQRASSPSPVQQPPRLFTSSPEVAAAAAAAAAAVTPSGYQDFRGRMPYPVSPTGQQFQQGQQQQSGAIRSYSRSPHRSPNRSPHRPITPNQTSPNTASPLHSVSPHGLPQQYVHTSPENLMPPHFGLPSQPPPPQQQQLQQLHQQQTSPQQMIQRQNTGGSINLNVPGQVWDGMQGQGMNPHFQQ